MADGFDDDLASSDGDAWDADSSSDAPTFDGRRLGLVIGAVLAPVAAGLVVWRVVLRPRRRRAGAAGGTKR